MKTVAEEVKKSARYNTHLSNDGHFKGVTSCIKIIIRKRVKYADNLAMLYAVG